jgi:hypothetical protein
LITSEFLKLGFNVLHVNKPKSANGVDLWVQKPGGRPISVEIKKSRKDKSGTYKIDPVHINRRSDDLIAVFIGEQYVLIEPMSDHIKCCSKTGVRMLTILCGKN